MSLTTVEISGQEYLVYANIAEADRYLVIDPVRGPAWALLTALQKNTRLVAGTRRVDLETYPGHKTVATQEREFPRTGATCDGVIIPPGVIPIQLETATIILAGSISASETATAAGSGPSNIERVKAGSAEVSFFNPSARGDFRLSSQNPDAYAVLKCLLGGGRSGGVGFGKVSGSGGKSIFDNRDAPALSEGLS